MDANGVILFIGVRKSGFIMQKITQIFVSTSMYVLHGDIGIVEPYCACFVQ